MKNLNCIHIPHHKNTEDSATISLPLPSTVTIPMSQSMGAPCSALVKVGDEVKVGQKIGDTDAFMSAPIHSSVSGKVAKIIDYLLPNGSYCQAIVIETDGAQTISDEVCPPTVNDRESFIKAVRDSGCCGLGGAGFPTHIKLNFDKSKTPIDTLVINAAECEPYITSDYREMVENPKDILEGILLIMNYLDIKTTKICIESNKPKAIANLTEMLKSNANIDVVSLPSSYPQGAEKVVVYSATGRIIGEGQLPSHLGCMVMNVSTVSFIYRYLQDGMPLISRRMTIDGSAVKKPCNAVVLIGTCVQELLDYTESSEPAQLLSGGPMMGMCLINTESTIVKTTNSLLAFSEVKKHKTTACIRCGKCIRACPINLMPTELEKAYDNKDIEALDKLRLMLCMNCGSCSYVCPAKRNLAEKNQLAKALMPRK